MHVEEGDRDDAEKTPTWQGEESEREDGRPEHDAVAEGLEGSVTEMGPMGEGKAEGHGRGRTVVTVRR